MSEQLPSGERGVLSDPADLPRPALWPEPPRGAQPVPVHGRDKGGPEEEIAQRRLPLAWTGVGLLVLALVVVGLAIVAQSWWLVAVGVVVGAVGAACTLKSRILEAATVGQSVKDS
jgi:hypothetical protein